MNEQDKGRHDEEQSVRPRSMAMKICRMAPSTARRSAIPVRAHSAARKSLTRRTKKHPTKWAFGETKRAGHLPRSFV